MKYVTLKRVKTDDQGTEGLLSIEDSPTQFHTLELPWRLNQSSLSCIPPGQHVAKWVLSEKRKRNIYQLMGTEPRLAIQIHSGNFAGDTTKGFKSHVEGCILMGGSIGELEGQKAVLASKASLAHFESIMEHEDFLLTIEDHIGAAV